MIQALIGALLLAVGGPDYPAIMKTAHVSGMQVVVVEGGKVVRNDAYGVRSIAKADPVDVHTRFEIGSITKQFTAAAILQLRDRGKLSLDDRLGRYFPRYAPGRDITLRQMLLQISGIPNYTDTRVFRALVQKQNGTYVVARPGNIRAVIDMIANEKLDFPPGSKWEYSNSNYYLLGEIVARVSHMPWSEYIAQNIFAKAGMTESSFMENESRISDMATGYTVEKNAMVPTGSFVGWAEGAGAIVSTASDLAKWDEALFSGKIVPLGDVSLMTSPGTLPALQRAHYGFGWIVDSYEGQPRVWHNGGTLGFSSSNQLYPKQSQIVIVLTNNSAGGADSFAQMQFASMHPQLAVANAKPAAGEDPAITARVKDVYAQMMSGNVDRSKLTDRMNGALTSDVLAGVKSKFAVMGDPVSWVFREKKAENGMTEYTYRVTFAAGGVLDCIMTLTPDGKVAGYGFTSPA